MHTQTLPTRPVDSVVTITLFCDEEQWPSCTVEVKGNLPQDRALRRAFNAVSGSLARISGRLQPQRSPDR